MPENKTVPSRREWRDCAEALAELLEESDSPDNLFDGPLQDYYDLCERADRAG
jgi:hypothetical protein